MTDPRKICARMIDMASCLETFGGWPRILAWNLGIVALLQLEWECGFEAGSP